MTNQRALAKLTFRFGNLTFPVSIYKATDCIGLSGQLFHEGCNGKIRQWKTCEEHPNTADPATFSGIVVGDKIVPITPNVKSQLLGGVKDITVVSVHKMATLPPLMEDGAIVVSGNCYLRPDKFLGAPFSDLLGKLRSKRKFLLITVPDGALMRFAILLPSGLVLKLFYKEEVRENEYKPKRSPIKSRMLDDMLAREDTFPSLSASPILDRVEDWIIDSVKGGNKKIVAYGKDNRVNA